LFILVRVVGGGRPAPDPANPSTHGRPVEVVLTCGRRIAVPPGFDPVTLLRAVALLEQPAR
jgi:hypothetical protein